MLIKNGSVGWAVLALGVVLAVLSGCGGGGGGGDGDLPTIVMGRGEVASTTVMASTNVPAGATITDCFPENTVVEPATSPPIQVGGTAPGGIDGNRCTSDLTIQTFPDTICGTYTITQPFFVSYTLPGGQFGDCIEDQTTCQAQASVRLTVQGCPAETPGISCTRCQREYSYNGFGQQTTIRNDCGPIPNYAAQCGGNLPPGQGCSARFNLYYNGLGQVLGETIDSCLRAG